MERAAECLADCFGANVSTGYLSGLLPAAARRLEAFLALVGKELAGAGVVHFDETGGRVAAKLRWVHVMCTGRWTLYHLDDRRGKTAMDAAGVLPGFTGIAVHDGLAAYRQYDTAEHALCNAHHLRELAGIAQLTGQDWPTELADLLDPHRGRARPGQRPGHAAGRATGGVRPPLRRAGRHRQTAQPATAPDRQARPALSKVVLSHLNEYLIRWAMWKYKRMRRSPRKAAMFLARITRSRPDLFAHWRLASIKAGATGAG